MAELRPSSLKERKEFYEKEFSIKKVRSWFSDNPQFFVVDIGTETHIIKDRRRLKKLIILEPDISYNELKEKLIQLAPEDVYYDRNKYIDIRKPIKLMDFSNEIGTKNCLGQELVFDIDPENISCPFHKKDFHKFCPICIKKSLDFGLAMKKTLSKNFKRIKLVYSGRGCHVHVKDKKAFGMSIKQRSLLNKKLKEFPIDPWVSKGHIRLIRLPYSLNSLVSRIALPLNDKEIKNFDAVNEKKIIPAFLRG